MFTALYLLANLVLYWIVRICILFAGSEESLRSFRVLGFAEYLVVVVRNLG